MFYILKNLERLVEEMFLVRGLGFLMIWFYIIKKNLWEPWMRVESTINLTFFSDYYTWNFQRALYKKL